MPKDSSRVTLERRRPTSTCARARCVTPYPEVTIGLACSLASNTTTTSPLGKVPPTQEMSRHGDARSSQCLLTTLGTAISPLWRHPSHIEAQFADHPSVSLASLR